MTTPTTREQAIRAAGLALAEARRRRDTLPIHVAARNAVRAGGPPQSVLEQRILARRNTQQVAA